MILRNLKTYNEPLISLFSRAVTIICIFLITAITSRKLDDTDFAIWTLFITIINLVPLLNFGLNIGLVNKLTYLNSKQSDKLKINNLVTSFLFFQILISTLLIIIFFTLNFSFEINQIKTLKSQIQSIELIIILIFISIPFQVYSSVLYSFKKINIANLSTALQNIILLLSVVVVSENFLENFVFNYSISYLLIFLVFYALSFIFLKLKVEFNKIRLYINEFKSILYKSLEFWVLSVISNILNTGQLLIVGLFFGLSQIPAYFLIQKLFSLLNTFHLAFISPYNVKFISNAANDNWSDSKNIINTLLYKISIPFFLISGIVILFFHSELIMLWSSKEIINYYSCILFLISGLCLGISNIYSVFLNSLGLFKFQLKLAFLNFLIFLLVFIFSKNFLNEFSVIFATIPSLTVIIILYRIYFNKIINNKLINI